MYTSMERESSYGKMIERTFDPERANLVKVVAVYVRVHSKQSPHNRAHGVLERSGECHTYDLVVSGRNQEQWEGNTDGIGEGGLVVEEILGPVHQGVDIFRRRELRWALVPDAILPEVFVPDR